MCIIVVKPEKIALPKEKVLKNCFNSNPDGAGFAFTKNTTNYLFKGYFDFDKFYNDLTAQVKKEYPCIIHFRIATAGKVDGGNCHPFPVTNKINILRQTKVITNKIMVVHNGIIQNESHYKLSDTQVFIKDILSNKVIYDNIYDNPAIEKLIVNYGGSSKFAFLHTQKGILLLGDFIKDYNCYFSNNSYKNIPILDYKYSDFLNYYDYNKHSKCEDIDNYLMCDICQSPIKEPVNIIEDDGGELLQICEECKIIYDYNTIDYEQRYME
mgnify:CR=1 FL=1